MTEPTNNSPNRWYELGAVLLVPATVYLSFSAGRVRGFEGAELVGYSLGGLTTALIIVGLSQLMKPARSRRAITAVFFFTMLFFLVGTAGSLFQERARQFDLTTDIDPASLDVNEEQAVALAQQIEESVEEGQLSDIQALYDRDRFAKRALRGQDTKSRHLLDIAQGGGRAFAKNPILEQLASLSKAEGFFNFVKFYRRDGEPILQFRLTDAAGGLHYVDFYIFKTGNDKLGVDDIRYYNSGEPLSKQLILSLANQDGSALGGESVGVDDFRHAGELAQQGKVQEAAAIIEALPEDLKREKLVMRLRVQLAYSAEAPNADQLFDEFTERFPGDPSIVFSAYVRAAARDDLVAVADLLDDIYRIVDGDEYLLWYKVQLLVAEEDYKRAVATLSEMETRYGIDVLSHAEHQLSEGFRSSKEYRAWLRAHAGGQRV